MIQMKDIQNNIFIIINRKKHEEVLKAQYPYYLDIYGS